MSVKCISTPSLSIIVPAFNASRTIVECLESIFSIQQILVETIVVNDGSTDDTLDKIRSVTPPALHSLIVISTPNQGVSNARNTGLKSAQGEIVAFVDSDDTIASTDFLDFYYHFSKSNCDVAIGGIKIKFATKNIELRQIPQSLSNIVTTGEDAFNILHRTETFTPLVFAYLWKKRFITQYQLQFQFKMSEDDLWTTTAICQAHSFLFTNHVHYNYVKRKQSLTGSNKASQLRQSCHYAVASELSSFVTYQNLLIKTKGWIACKILYLVCDVLDTAAAVQTTATIQIEICNSAKYYIVNSQDAQIQRIGFIYLYRIKQFVKQGVGLLV